MPATIFNPLAAIVVHSHVPVNALTFTLMEAEEALLVHKCTRQATRQEWRRYNKSGKLIVYVRHSPLLTYHVQATSLDPTGENLGNCQPGMWLSDRALDFINGGRVPFQFESEATGGRAGKFMLKDPVQEPGAGDATEVDFTIEHAFIDYDIPNYPPGISTVPPVTTTVEMDAQAAAELTVASLGNVLRDIFHNAGNFTGNATATLYDGPTAVSSPEISGAWTDLNEPVGTSPSEDAGPEITWSSEGISRSVSMIRVARGAAAVEITLSSPITLPAGSMLHADAADLIAMLSWPLEGAAPAATERPARFALRHALGDASAGLGDPGTTLLVECWDADPATTGTLLDSFTVARDATIWGIYGLTATNDAVLTGTTLSPAGWSIAFVTVKIPGVGTWFIKDEFTSPLVIAAGNPVILIVNALAIDLTQ